MQTHNYVLGRGKIYFDKFIVGTETRTGERYIGNTPTLSMNATYQDLPHYSSDAGIRELDDNVTLQTDRGGTFTCDNVSIENVALWFGSADAVDESVLASTAEVETIEALLGYYFQLGTSTTIPDGVGNVNTVVVTNTSGIHASGTITVAGLPLVNDTVTINGQAMSFETVAAAAQEVTIGATVSTMAQNIVNEINAYPLLYDVTATRVGGIVTIRSIVNGTAGNAITLTESATNITVSGATLAGGAASGVIVITDNYEIDLVNGRLHLLDGSPAITEGDVLEVQYNIGVSTRQTVVDDNTQVEGLLRFIADNPKGTNKNYTWPRVKLTPSGEYGLKGETWQTMTFNFSVLKPAVGQRVYVREAA